jgi:hypothetical protein
MARAELVLYSSSEICRGLGADAFEFTVSLHAYILLDLG